MKYSGFQERFSDIAGNTGRNSNVSWLRKWVSRAVSRTFPYSYLWGDRENLPECRVLRVPCDLPFCIIPIMLCDERPASLEIDRSIEILDHFLVSDRFESGGVRILFSKVSHFIGESFSKHFSHTSIDLRIELFSISIVWRHEKCGKKKLWNVLYFCLWSSSRLEYFDRTNNPMDIIFMDFHRRFWIDRTKHLPDFCISTLFWKFFQFISSRPVWFISRVASLQDEAIEIESCSTAEDRDFSTSVDVSEDFPRHLLKFHDGKSDLRRENIDHIVWNIAHFFGRDFSSSDIHFSIYLSRIDRNNLSTVLFRETDRERCFSWSSRSEHDNDRVYIFSLKCAYFWGHFSAGRFFTVSFTLWIYRSKSFISERKIEKSGTPIISPIDQKKCSATMSVRNVTKTGKCMYDETIRGFR